MGDLIKFPSSHEVAPPDRSLKNQSYRGMGDEPPTEATLDHWDDVAAQHRWMEAHPQTHPNDLAHHARLAAEAKAIADRHNATVGRKQWLRDI